MMHKLIMSFIFKDSTLEKCINQKNRDSNNFGLETFLFYSVCCSNLIFIVSTVILKSQSPFMIIILLLFPLDLLYGLNLDIFHGINNIVKCEK